MSPGDARSERSLGFHASIQRCDVVSHRQISRIDNRGTSPPRTRLAPVGSFCGNAIEATNTRSQTDAGAQSQPDALASAASLNRTKMAPRSAQAGGMNASQMTEQRASRFSNTITWPEGTIAGATDLRGRRCRTGSKNNRAGGIRTRDLLNPIQAHYQAVLRPDYAATIHRHTSDCQKSFRLFCTCLFSRNDSS